MEDSKRNSEKNLLDKTKNLEEKYKFQALLFLTLIILGIGTIFYYYIENLSWIDAFYFCSITLTTVGYGDISPETTLGKLFTVGYIFTGLGIIFAFIDALLARGKNRRQKKMENKISDSLKDNDENKQ